MMVPVLSRESGRLCAKQTLLLLLFGRRWLDLQAGSGVLLSRRLCSRAHHTILTPSPIKVAKLKQMSNDMLNADHGSYRTQQPSTHVPIHNAHDGLKVRGIAAWPDTSLTSTK